ncbi:MAG TPA: hypothetical protein VJ765_10325 [Chitinophagaceae bacterium]|nr:hypothetical protein [Chitinophagaceae bacterium]
MRIIRLIFIPVSLLLVNFCIANDSLYYAIKINFLYGSRPAKGYHKQESRRFGGIKGGHVNIEAAGRVLDFTPGKNPLFPNNKNPSGGFSINDSINWNSKTDKWTTIIVPVSEKQFTELQKLFDSVAAKTPYDYAIFGMRCAAASYDVLSKIGLFEEYPNTKNVVAHFYPKLLRKKVLKWANKNNYAVISNEGRSSRKWESDSGIL